jgi:flagella basal body P-ring formation protein FlgA
VAHSTSRIARLLRCAGLAAAVVAYLAGSAAFAVNLAPEEPVRLNTSITVTGKGVRLGDLFSGDAIDEDAIVADAPAPGQRTVLTADWLASVARAYQIEWRPSDHYDRTVVYRPGRALTPAQILAVFKEDLVAKGMPAELGLKPGSRVPTLIVPEEAVPPLTVRESYFDPITRTFSAVAEFVGAEDKPQFLKVRGGVVTTVSVPVLKEDLGRLKVITADMIDYADVPETSVRRETITDAVGLIGKSPKTVVRAGQPVLASEIVHLNLVDVPVLRGDLSRDDVIRESNITWATMNGAALPADVVTTADYLIGKSPRRMVAANAPIRRSDVIVAQEVRMAVASRDLRRGAVLDDEAVSWVPTGSENIGPGVIVDPRDLEGRVARYGVRAGRPLRTMDTVKPTVIAKNKLVTIIYAQPYLKLTVRGKALEDGAAQDTIRVANANSKSVVLAEVVDEDTVRVTAQQTAMR